MQAVDRRPEPQLQQLPYSKLEEMTPDWANKLLMKRSPTERRLDMKHMENLARLMKNEMWEINGKTICIDMNGMLLDGQHRLAACMRANTSFWTFIVYNLSAETHHTIDTAQRLRSVTQILHSRGEHYPGPLSAALRSLLKYERGWSMHVTGTWVYMAPAELQDALGRHPDIRSSVAWAYNELRWLRGHTGICAALHYLTTKSDVNKARSFWGGFGYGISEDGADPVAQLRNRLLEEQAKRGMKVPPEMIYRWLILTWNTWKAGRKPKHLKLAPRAGEEETQLRIA